MTAFDRLAWTLLHFVWQGVMVAACYAFVRGTVARRAGPNVRYALAAGTLALLSLLPLVTWLVLRPAPAPAPIATVAVLNASSHAPLAATVFPPVHPAALRAPRPARLAAAWLGGIVIVWFAGVVAGCFRLGVGWRAAARLRTDGTSPAAAEWQVRFARLRAQLRITRPVRLLASVRAATPAVIGWLRPVVLVPAFAFTGLPPEQLEAVLLHELAHICRHDYLINLWQNVVEVVLFYHPAVWWVSGHMRAEREFCCDDIAVAASGDSLVYMRALSQLEAVRPRLQQLAMAASGGSLLRRIHRLACAPAAACAGVAAPAITAGVLLVGLAAFSSALPHQAAQNASAPLRFEAVSIKPYAPNHPMIHLPNGFTPFLPGGRYVNPVASVRALVAQAYSIRHPDIELKGLPKSYPLLAVEAQAPAAAVQGLSSSEAEAKMRLMLQSLLADRFHLKLHTSSRPAKIYELRLSGAALKNVTPMSAPGAAKPGQNPGVNASWGNDGGHMIGNGASLQNIADFLTMVFGREVVDQTGVAGYYNFDIRWKSLEANVADPAGFGPGGQALFLTNLREQLGLRLVNAKGTEPLWIIDHVEPPTPN